MVGKIWGGGLPPVPTAKLSASGVLFFGPDISSMYTCVFIITVIYLHRFRSVIVDCHFNIYLTKVGVMHEAGYVYSIRST